jgi:tetratricopeptide (TPR) repeat protein
MAKCNYPEFQSLLHAYELGMLTDSQRAELEEHLMNCEVCFEKLTAIQEAIHILKNDPDIKKQTEEAVTETTVIEKSKYEGIRKSAAKSIWRRLIPAVGLVAVVIIILVLSPWQVDIKPTQEAVAFENRIVIMYFVNLSEPEDEKKLAEITTDLLINDLAESQYIKVVSSQRLYDLLKLIGREGENKVERDVASQIAQKANARWMLLGNILQTDPQPVLTSQLVDVTTGDAVASQKVVGEAGENIFSVVDKLTIQLKHDLGFPDEAMKEVDQPIANITTNSLEAYRYYLEGREFLYKYYWPEAEEKYKKALEYDSTFAMAYTGLAAIKAAQGDPAMVEMAGRALQYYDRATRHEKYYITAINQVIKGEFESSEQTLQQLAVDFPQDKSAFYWLGVVSMKYLKDYKKALGYFNSAIELDSLYKNPYQHLSRLYEKSGEENKAIHAINMYISLAPNEAEPYHMRGKLYLYRNVIDSAIASFEGAVYNKPDYYKSWDHLTWLYLQKREFKKAKMSYERLVNRPEKNLRSDARSGLALVSIFQGRFNQALKELDDGIKKDEEDGTYHGDEGDMANKYMYKALIYYEKIDVKKALEEIENSMDACKKVEPVAGNCYTQYYIWLLGENGEISKAEEALSDLKQQIEKNNLSDYQYWFAKGYLKYIAQDFDLAADCFEKAIYEYGKSQAIYMLGRTYLELNNPEKALYLFGKIRDDAFNKWQPFIIVKTDYYLGQAYEATGQTDKALYQYQEFLKWWGDGDQSIKEITEAKRKISDIKQ